MIRPLVKSDAAQLVDLGKEFWHKCNMSKTGDYPKDAIFRRLYSGLLENKIIGWGYEENKKIVSGIIFVIIENFWLYEKQMQELAWFCSEEKRGSLNNIRLLKAAEKYAKENNIRLFCMGGISGSPSFEKLEKFYNKNGFFILDRNYLKIL
jgi:hypothetical protein